MKKVLVLFSLLLTTLFSADSRVEVHGTSTLHDWMMASEKATVTLQGDGKKITELVVSLPIESLKSDDDSLDKNAYETIYDAGVEKGENIVFTLNSHNSDGSLDGVFSIGNKELTTTVMPDFITSNEINGTLDANMTSFGLEPPSFLFGAMSTGDQVTIKYSIKQK